MCCPRFALAKDGQGQNNPAMLKIWLNGALGRMGQAIQAAAEGQECVISAKADADLQCKVAMSEVDVVIDFSLHHATAGVVAEAATHGKPVVIGTTGHTPQERETILAHTQAIPIVWAGNYSIGVNLLFFLTRKAAELLDESYEPEIVEMHHHHKQDAPSGTAERLIEQVLAGRHWPREAVRHGREGLVGERPARELGVHALRGGSVVGDHQVIFAGQGERFELAHQASDRRIFAQGALRAARWVLGQPAGLYNMEDVLGLK